MEELHGVRHKTKRMGLQFKISPGDLKSFELESKSCEEQLEKVLDWLDRNKKLKWSHICCVLETKSVGEPKLASLLRKKYYVPTPGIFMFLFSHHAS